VQLALVVHNMDIVEHQLLIVVLYLMAIVVIQHVVLVFAVHDLDIVVQLALIAHLNDHQMLLNQLQLKAIFKVKQHIIMKLKLVRTIHHAVLNEHVH